MTGLPTPHTLQVRHYNAGEPDEHGNPTATFADPVPWPVAGIAAGTNLEEGDTATASAADHRDNTAIVWTVYAPKSDLVPTERDRVLVAGDEYAVDARPQDWTNGPWPHPATGVVVHLVRKEG